LWLEADVLIRQKSKGARSLDDFCRKFHGGQGGAATLATYTLDDVVKALEEVEPNDWRGFFAARVDAVTAHPPLDGITRGGYKLAYNDTPNKATAAFEKLEKFMSFGTSLGMWLREDGTLADVIPGMPAAQAGLAPGMKMLGVNGRKWSPPLLHDAIKAAEKSGAIEILVENSEWLVNAKLKYKGGEQKPHVERDSSKPDLLGEIMKPRAKGEKVSVNSAH
jgi:predicted metalloprotease with PDZ domain